MTMTIDLIRVAQSVALAKREIQQDIDNAIVPFDVADFSSLHNYVDANEYGGLCDQFGDGLEEGDHTFANEVQDRVDVWLKARAACVGPGLPRVSDAPA